MKKIILTSVISLVIISSLFLPVFAQDQTKSWKEQVELYQAKRAEMANIKSNVKEKVAIIRSNKLENQLIWSDNSNLRAQVKIALGELRESDVSIDDAIKAQLKSLGDTLKIKYQELNSTSGDVRELTIQINDLVKARNTDALNEIYGQIIDIQLFRNGILSEINDILTEIIAIL